jgi:alpha-mannosidase
LRLLIDTYIPAMGYSTYIVRECVSDKTVTSIEDDLGRVEKPVSLVMENAHVRIELDELNCAVKSWIDKKTGKELADASRPAGVFRLIEEDMPPLGGGMSSWMVGRYMKMVSLNEEYGAVVTPVSMEKNSLRQSLQYRINFRSSSLRVLLSLDHDSPQLVYDVICEWREHPAPEKYIPQLNFAVPLACKVKEYLYNIPFGVIIRPESNSDFPANNWIAAVSDDESPVLSIITDSKYGFRGYDNTISVSLIRSSFHPDPNPECANHHIKIAVGAVQGDCTDTLMKRSFDFNHTIGVVSGVKRKGKLPLEMSLLTLESGSVEISAIKLPENPQINAVVIRFYELSDKDSIAIFKFPQEIKEAWYTDINENKLSSDFITIEGNTVKVPTSAYAVSTIIVELK